MYLQLNMVKYDADQEITNIYKNLQTVWSQFFTDMLLFIYIRSTSNIYWFIGIRIHCQRRAIQLLSTICNIRSALGWAIPKVILNYSLIPSLEVSKKENIALATLTLNVLPFESFLLPLKYTRPKLLARCWQNWEKIAEK